MKIKKSKLRLIIKEEIQLLKEKYKYNNVNMYRFKKGDKVKIKFDRSNNDLENCTGEISKYTGRDTFVSNGKKIIGDIWKVEIPPSSKIYIEIPGEDLIKI